MRRLGVIFASFIFLTLFAGSIYAFSHPIPVDEGTRPGVIKREEVRQKIEERRATRQAQLSERRMNLIRAFFNRMVRRIEAAISRLERLITRIESRIAKLEAAGEDMTDIKEQVGSAKTKLAGAKDDLQEAKDGLEEVLVSDNPKEAFKEVGKTVRGIVRSLVEIHRILVQVIGDIKGLRVGEERMPSPTPTPTP